MKTNSYTVSAEAHGDSPPAASSAVSAPHDAASHKPDEHFFEQPYDLLVGAMRLIVKAPTYTDAAQHVAGFMRSHCGLCLLVVVAQEGEGLRHATYGDLPGLDEAAGVLAGIGTTRSAGAT